MRNLHICERPYPLYRTLIKAMHEPGQHDILLSNHVAGMEKMLQPLRESGIFRDTYFFDDIEYKKFYQYGTANEFCKFPKGIFMLVKKMYLYFKLSKHAKSMKLPEGLDITKYDNIYVNNAVSSFNLYLHHRKQKFICVEHARNAFQKGVEYPIYLFAFRISGWFAKAGLLQGLPAASKDIKCLEVSDASNLISLVKKKRIREISLEKLISELTEAEKNKIFKVYSKAYQLEIPERGEIGILLTQPLYNDALLQDEATQIRFYHKIVKEYLKDMDIILIKAHPRDTVNYENFTANSIVVNAAISAEILNFSSKIYFEKAVTVNSSTIHSFVKAKQRIVLGEKYIQQFLS